MKKSKKIPAVVLDVDDTVVSFITFLCYIFNAKYHTCITEADLTSWNFNDAKVTDAQGKIIEGSALREFFIDYEDAGLYAAIPPIKESVFAMTLMKKLGYKVILLTARKEIFAKDTEINFLYHNVPYDEIIYNAEKVEQIKKLAKTHSIMAFADDRYSYVKAVTETDLVNTCYLVNKAHNKNEPEIEGMKRINDLLEIVRYLPEVVERIK